MTGARPAVTPPEVFTPLAPSPGVVGDPIGDSACWAAAQRPDAGAVAVELMVLRCLGLAGAFTEHELAVRAYHRYWFIPGGGTPPDAVGNLCASLGAIAVHQRCASLDELEDHLIGGARVIALVSDAAAPPGQDTGRAVQVTGIDWTARGGVRVILNDPRATCPATTWERARFERAWEPWERRIVAVRAPG